MRDIRIMETWANKRFLWTLNLSISSPGDISAVSMYPTAFKTPQPFEALNIGGNLFRIIIYCNELSQES